MGDGAPDPEGKASAKRKRIDALDRRFAGGRGASLAARASASRPGDGPRGRHEDRSPSARRDARVAHVGGRSARDANPAVDRAPSRPRPVDARAPPEAPADAPWYAPLSARVARGALAAATVAGSLPFEETHADARRARTAYVERALVALAETSERTGADVDAVVRGKTRDKVVLLDAANAAPRVGAAGRARRQTKPTSRAARHASNAWLRPRGVRGALTCTSAPSGDARDGERGLAERLADRLRPLRRAFLASLAGAGPAADPKDRAEKARNESDDASRAARRLAEVKKRVVELGEVRGGTVRVVSCRDVKLVGRRGVVARVTARAAHVVAEARPRRETKETRGAPSVFVAPRNGTTFRLELESFEPLSGGSDGEGAGAWVDMKGENLAGG